MSDEERILRLAREAWRGSLPGHAEVAIGAARVSRKMSVARATWRARRLGAVTTLAAAAVIAAAAYAGRGSWRAPSSASGLVSPMPPIAIEAPVAAAPDPPLETHADPKPPSPNELVPPRSAPRAAPKLLAVPSPEATWLEVSEALAAHDHARAEQLLSSLTDRGHDANTRAKAYLGLAQLDEARGHSAAARTRALTAAAIPGIEIKTLRRALELAARCAQ